MSDSIIALLFFAAGLFGTLSGIWFALAVGRVKRGRLK